MGFSSRQAPSLEVACSRLEPRPWTCLEPRLPQDPRLSDEDVHVLLDFLEGVFGHEKVLGRAEKGSPCHGVLNQGLDEDIRVDEKLQESGTLSLLYLSAIPFLMDFPTDRASASVNLLLPSTSSIRSSFLAYSQIACLATSLHLISGCDFIILWRSSGTARVTLTKSPLQCVMCGHIFTCYPLYSTDTGENRMGCGLAFSHGHKPSAQPYWGC